MSSERFQGVCGEKPSHEVLIIFSVHTPECGLSPGLSRSPRTKVLNSELEEVFRRWWPRLRAIAD